MFEYITKTFSYISKALKYFEDSKDPFEAGDLEEVKTEFLPEIIEQMILKIEDPIEIINLMKINRTWYMEGKRILYKDREVFMDWLRLRRINQLDSFIRYLKIDRLDEYIRIYNKLRKKHMELTKKYIEAELNVNIAHDKLPYDYHEYGFIDDEHEEAKELLIVYDEKVEIYHNINIEVNKANNELERFEIFVNDNILLHL